MGVSDIKYLPEAIKELARYAVVESEFFDLIAPKGISQKHLNEIYSEIDSAVDDGHAFKVFCGIRDAYDYASRRELPFEGTSARESVLKIKSTLPERTVKYLAYSQRDTSLQEIYQKILSGEEKACNLALDGKYQEAVDVYREVLKIRGDLSGKAKLMSPVN